ncbi:MAG: sodium-translocating pyrophosphatase [Labilithrix sp.]|nr:sodium-translocating pyrophosphatase [Labilithrix sp.]
MQDAVTPWIGFILAAGASALVASLVLARGVFAADAGTEKMTGISDAIREGAGAFQRRQYRTVALYAVVAAVAVFAVAGHAGDGRGAAWRATIAFVAGALCSAASGWWGMFVSLRANLRVASAARTSMAGALRLALRGGAAAGLPVVAVSLLGVLTLFVLFGGTSAPETVPHQIVGFAFGASFVALFAQLGGGIYTKAADIGADLVGKVEVGIPEDDPRNPAIIADLVGDNVGDCAGRGADIFESAAAENIGAMILGVALFPLFGVAGILFPLVTGAAGLVASLAGVLVVKMKGDDEDPMSAMTRGHLATLLLATAGMWAAVRYLLGGNGWLFVAGAIGLVASFVFAAIARYYTGTRHAPVRWVAESSVAGPSTNVIAGLSVALESPALPVVTIGVALFGAYACGVVGLPGVADAGLYGTAIATAGMLASVAYVLAMDMYGPITDNAGGIVEMSGEDDGARARTDRLDAAGNTTKATTKGYAIGSAALAAFLLFSAYLEEVTRLARAKLERLGDPHWDTFRFDAIDLAKVPVFVAALLGGAIVFLFSGLAIRAVVRDAHAVIEEVRRQLRDNPGILARTSRPDYARCVDIVTRGALRGMLAPGLVAVAGPVLAGVLFARAATATDPWLGAEAVGALLMSGTIAGVLLASGMNTGGAAWDNAKKLIETGALGGPGSDVHKASVVGDAVGDPLKDTAGPSLHILIKLLGTVSLVTAPLFV